MQNGRVELQKTLSPSMVWALALGAIIGWGCFVLPGDLLNKSGPLGMVTGFLLGALFMVVIALSYGVMVKNVPVSGGEFAYAYYAAGRQHAYICGWFLTLGYLSIVALNGTAVALLGKFYFPGLFERGYLYEVAGWKVYLGEVLLASLAIILFGILNYRGVQIMGAVQLLIVVLLCAGVAMVGLGVVFSPQAGVGNLQPLFAPGKSAIACIAAVLAISPWLYVGFDTIPQSAEEFNFSHDKSLRLMIFAILIGAVMYTVVGLSTALVKPWQELLAARTAWATGTAVKMSMGAWGLFFLGLGMAMAIASGINGFYMATSRLLFSMGRARVLPAWFTDVHPDYQTPHKAVLFVMILALLAPWFGRQVVLWIVDMSAVGTAIGYLYTCLGSWRFNQRNPQQAERLGSKWVAGLGMVFSLVILALLLTPGSPAFLTLPSWVALAAWVVLGVYFYITRAKVYNRVPAAELDYLIMGENAVQYVSLPQQKAV